MEVPFQFALSSWFPFIIASLLIIFFSAIYVRWLASRYESETSTTVTAILGLVIAFLASLLLPVDIFSVSFLKYSNGTYKEWAANETFRASISDTMLQAYIAFYSLVLIFSFLILPFMYFFYEETDELEDNITKRLCSALKYTSGFLLAAGILLLVGVVLPIREAPATNSTEWEKLKFLIHTLQESQAKEALFFTLGVLTTLGLLSLNLYTAVGLAAWPIQLIRGYPYSENQVPHPDTRRSQTHVFISSILARHNAESEDRSTFPSRGRELFTGLEESQNLLTEQEADQPQKTLPSRLRPLYRPFQILAGVLMACFGFFIWISLLITNIDKVLHSLGYHLGYLLPENDKFKPLDMFLVASQKYFPLDYLIFTGIVLFLFVCTLAGLQRLGLWLFCVKLYNIHPRRTSPQALLLICQVLMYTLLTIDLLLYNLCPQYVMYGDQFYQGNLTANATREILRCKNEAPTGECMMTQAGVLLMDNLYNMWYFAVLHFWGSWLFLLMVVVGFFWVVVCPPRAVTNLEDSEEDSLLRP